MQLINALRYSHNTVTAFVGAGGKTTALFQIARELSEKAKHENQNPTVLVTTTTHLGAWQLGMADKYICIKSEAEISHLKLDLIPSIILLTGEETNNRLPALSPELLYKVRIIAEEKHLPLLIEADGSGTRPLKAPAKHEPVIPEFTNHVVVVAGLTGLEKPLVKNWVHRPEIFASLSGLNLGEVVTATAIVNVLKSEVGGLKNIPRKARRIVLLNQADDINRLSKGKVIASELINYYQAIVVASLSKQRILTAPDIGDPFDQQGEIHAVYERIGGIVLAAGGSNRFGKPKQLLPWKGQPFIRHVVNSAINAGLFPVIVVVGSSAEEIVNKISDLPVRIVTNMEWKTGLSSSIRAGITAMPEEVGGVIFLQADQPQISPLLMRSLVEAHQETLSPIVAPEIDGHRGNPVLFDIETFHDLLSLIDDMGGRTLFSRYPIQWVTWHDPNQLMDIDTPSDYQKFLEIFKD